MSSGSLDPGAMVRLRELARDIDPGLFSEILATFRDDVGKYLAGMQRALEEKDTCGVKRNAHAMKGACLNTGALTLMGLSARMEEAAEAMDDAVMCNLLLPLETEAQKVQAEIAIQLSAAP
jgi:HPt (histidine-containing phosphotransfer) domain-containing protein